MEEPSISDGNSQEFNSVISEDVTTPGRIDNDGDMSSQEIEMNNDKEPTTLRVNEECSDIDKIENECIADIPVENLNTSTERNEEGSKETTENPEQNESIQESVETSKESLISEKNITEISNKDESERMSVEVTEESHMLEQEKKLESSLNESQDVFDKSNRTSDNQSTETVKIVEKTALNCNDDILNEIMTNDDLKQLGDNGCVDKENPVILNTIHKENESETESKNDSKVQSNRDVNEVTNSEKIQEEAVPSDTEIVSAVENPEKNQDKVVSSDEIVPPDKVPSADGSPDLQGKVPSADLSLDTPDKVPSTNDISSEIPENIPSSSDISLNKPDESSNSKSGAEEKVVEPVVENSKDDIVQNEVESSAKNKSSEEEQSDPFRAENEADNEIVENEHNDNTEFVQVNSEKDDNEKDQSKNDELLEDPIGGGDENDTIDSMAEGADEELCIIPDTERVLSQAEKDAATPLNNLSVAETANVTAQNSSKSDETITIIKYKEKESKTCVKCAWIRVPKYEFKKAEVVSHLCNDECLENYKKSQSGKIVLNWDSEIRVKDLTPKSSAHRRICVCCKEEIFDEEVHLSWEIMDFCNEICLTKYQKEIGSKCASCSCDVRANSLGKYCVRFGNDIRQFCSSHCLENYKEGLKVCSYCQQEMSSVSKGFLAVGEKGQFKDFCSQFCMDRYDVMTNNKPPKVDDGTTCCVCKLNKTITMSFSHGGVDNFFCGEPCFVAFSFVNSIKSGKCSMCCRNYSNETLEEHTMNYEESQRSFCSNSCQNIYIIAHRKIVPCTWCKVKKYNFDMIRRFSKNGPLLNMCSVNCLNLYQVSMNAVSSKKTQCDFCHKSLQAMYHLTMSDATIRNFCSYACVMSFQNQYNKSPIMISDNASAFPVPTGAPKRSKRLLNKMSEANSPRNDTPTLPVISSVQSLANSNGTLSTRNTRSKVSTLSTSIQNNIEIPVQVKHHIIVKSAAVPSQRNVATMCRTRMTSKGVTAAPKVENAQVQTEKREAERIIIPVPVPIFVPLPMHMFAAPVPMPVPIPIPVPVPIFIPTTRNSANGIMKEIKKIQVKIPTNPYEAELLMMAEMVADDKKEENTDSESEVEDNGADDGGGGGGSSGGGGGGAGGGGGFSPDPQDGSNTFGDDMLQMALKMATEYDEPAVDLEGALTANTITASQSQDEVHHQESSEEVPQEQMHLIDRGGGQRGKKRVMRGNARGQGSISKRGRRSLSQHVDMPLMQQPQPPPEPQEKPDANMCLKYTFGVNAWKQWVTFKNAELEKSSRRMKLFKTEILQLTADELNYSLCLFVKEVRKPNGAEYAPDTIYYLCLGIQQYLFENGRIDNIFCDAYYEKFTDCLDEVAKRFSVLYNDSHYIVTRVEEEHLWESKQLGAHSPHVLLSTLMFFNTKHFNLTTVDEHMQLSFSHIMKHWKRNPNQAGASKVPGSRNVLLRFYPPQSAIQNNARKKKVYEQQENEENPLRCPVKLYEFYLSKCPESVKTRNDVFYLQPERSCVPDSPVWYSTMPLPRDALEKMLHRVKMVKEINVALLTS